MKLKEERISSQLVYDGKILSLYVDDVRLPDGKQSKRECVRHCGGACVLIIKDGKIALVKQYRYLYGKEIYEIPAGKMDEGEQPEMAAKRELKEETGYKAEVKHLLDIYPTPGYTDEVIHIFYAENGEYVGERLDEGEFLNCEFFTVDKVLKMIEEGEICDAKTVSAVYKYLYESNKNT
ncbi:MAG: NUDIX domain-containing protein [Candidatus Coproplasma sp.]